jgi:predicted dehydrogenase
MTERLRWGVLGAARIATTKVIPAIQRARACEVTAIASRDATRASEAARLLGIPKAYASYEALLDDPDIDVVYNPLPNHLHVPWTAAAAEAGKHVLCEKPIALSAAEARQLLAVRNRSGVYVQEAFMVRTHPQWVKAREIVRSGRLGEIRSISGYFSFYNDDPTNIRNVAAFGGGALMDIGCYLVHSSRFIFEREPRRAIGLVDDDPRLGIDRMTSMLLDFDGAHSVGTCTMQAIRYQRMHIVGTGGRIEIEIPFNAPPDRPCRLFVDCDGDPSGSGVETVSVDTSNQFAIQAELFARAILEGTEQALPLEDSVRNMECIDALVRSAANGCWESVQSANTL